MSLYELQLTFDWSQKPESGKRRLDHALLDSTGVQLNTSSGKHKFEPEDHVRLFVLNKQGLAPNQVPLSLDFVFEHTGSQAVGYKDVPFEGAVTKKLNKSGQTVVTYQLCVQEGDTAFFPCKDNGFGTTLTQNLVKSQKKTSASVAWKFDIHLHVSGVDEKDPSKSVMRMFEWDPELIVGPYD